MMTVMKVRFGTPHSALSAEFEGALAEGALGGLKGCVFGHTGVRSRGADEPQGRRATCEQGPQGRYDGAIPKPNAELKTVSETECRIRTQFRI
eukprot:2785188-Rhodomonas_salina.2